MQIVTGLILAACILGSIASVSARAAEPAPAIPLQSRWMGNCELPPGTTVSLQPTEIPSALRARLPALAPPGTPILTDIILPGDTRAAHVLGVALMRGENAVIFFMSGGGIGTQSFMVLATRGDMERQFVQGGQEYRCVRVRQALAPEIPGNESDRIAAIMAPCPRSAETRWSGMLSAVPAAVRERYPFLAAPGEPILANLPDSNDGAREFRLIGTVTEGEKWFVLLEKGGAATSILFSSGGIHGGAFDGDACRLMQRVGSGQR